MAPTKKIKRLKFIENDSVAAALKKGLVPYVDFVPTPKVDLKKIPKNKQINLRDDRQDTWENLGNIASMYYERPRDAIDVLIQGSGLFKNQSTNTFVLVAQIEKDLKKTKLKLNKLIDQNLEKYCPLIGKDYSNINASKRDLQTGKAKFDKKKLDRQKVIDVIIEKHRRLAKRQPAKLKDWLKSNSHLVQ